LASDSSPTPRRRAGTSAPKPTPRYPFAALVGQDDLKLALLLTVVDPGIGGVLVVGHRGTAKTTAVRGLAELLPEMPVVRGCGYRCDPARPAPECPDCRGREGEAGTEWIPVPVVDLPLGATEDRVVGSVDLERALLEGVQSFRPGLLARAHRGILYVDEVNLLEDHLVDLLLDVAVSGVNVVEREGLSVRHPARFILIGSGNPEEGDLRPQLLDRFGLQARIRTIEDLDQRVEIVRRRLAFEADPAAFARRFAKRQKELRERIAAARERHPRTRLGDAALESAARLCARMAIDGHRGELALCRGAVALAALEGRDEAGPEDVMAVAPLALAHRLRKDPLEPAADDERVRRALEEALD
jgi:magnesium chelatase subunit I